jgi:hypothetical protein
MNLKPYLLAPALLLGLSCEDQPYTSELLDARPDIIVSKISEAGLDHAGPDVKSSLESSCSCEDFVYRGVEEYKKSVETTLGSASAAAFDDLLRLYTVNLGVSFPDDTLNEFQELALDSLGYSKNILTRAKDCLREAKE